MSNSLQTETIDLASLGFSIIKDFISDQEESDLLSHINKSGRKENCNTRNSIQRFGPKKPYGDCILSNVIPDHFLPVIDKMMSSGLLEDRPNSVTINEYLSGQRILPHIDNSKCGEVITVLSLLSDAEMVFERDDVKQIVFLPRKCLTQMRGEIRWKWQHSIQPVVSERYSIVFRAS